MGKVLTSVICLATADPEAADYVFGQLCNIKVVGLDVTHSCKFTGEDLRGLQGRGRFGTFLSDITAFYLKYHKYGPIFTYSLLASMRSMCDMSWKGRTGVLLWLTR